MGVAGHSLVILHQSPALGCGLRGGRGVSIHLPYSSSLPAPSPMPGAVRDPQTRLWLTVNRPFASLWLIQSWLLLILCAEQARVRRLLTRWVQEAP